MPVRSPRRLYLISTITVPINNDPNAIDPVAGGTTRPVIAKIKESIGNFLGLTPLAFNDPLFTGVFGGGGTNAGAEFRRNLGGYKDASYKLIAETRFAIEEIVIAGDGSVTRPTRQFKSISIGFPKGHTVTEIIDWLGTTTRLNDIQSIVTPAGRRVDLFSPNN